MNEYVSVPIRGLFNLTEYAKVTNIKPVGFNTVSVPIRGLFNLTLMYMKG